MKESGFSLIEVTLATGLMCAAGLGLMKLMQNQNINVKTGEIDAEIMKTVTQVSKIISSKNGCNATLGNTLTKVMPANNLGAAGVDISSIRISNGNNYLSVGQKIMNDLVLNKISVKLLKQNFDPASGYGSGVVEMVFGKKALGGKTIIKRSEFYAKFTALKFYTVLTGDLALAKDEIKFACIGDLGTSNLSVNIIKSGVGSSIGECLPNNPTELFVQEC